MFISSIAPYAERMSVTSTVLTNYVVYIPESAVYTTYVVYFFFGCPSLLHPLTLRTHRLFCHNIYLERSEESKQLIFFLLSNLELIKCRNKVVHKHSPIGFSDTESIMGNAQLLATIVFS